MSSLTLNKITSQRGISVGEATKKISDLGWNPTYVQEAMTFPTDYKITKAPRDPMKQVLRSYFPMQEEKDNRVYGALDAALRRAAPVGGIFPPVVQRDLRHSQQPPPCPG